MQKGQLSLEFLLLLLLFLCLISISFFALTKTKGFVEAELEKKEMKKMLLGISSEAEFVCALGEGNVQIVKGKLNGFSLEKEGEILRIMKGDAQFEEKMPCAFYFEEGEYGGSVLVAYEDGAVRIRKS
ncbi:hypothetical protein AUJ17_05425 [Candidatus Micrarchaeota archaeon CG1_02_47_40]|nr:MAG: hypothetical protein AUJ17_05425 [Candidatus Micrarchaeota archaeon CG1_02_47_40]